VSSHQSTQWFWSDWAGDIEVRRLTPAERGLWMDLLCLAAVGKPIGYVCDQRGNPLSYEEIARFANCSPTEAESLIAGILEKGAGSRDRSGRLFNRRMTRQAEKRATKRKAGLLGAEQTKKTWSALVSNTLKLNEISSSALANATADARAPPTSPYQSHKYKTTSTVSEDTAGGSTNGNVRKLPHQATKAELDEIYASKARTQPAKG
jgi:hypothetical protein